MEDTLTYLAVVLVLGMAAQWLAWRFKLPSILLLLIFGFAAGQFLADPEEMIGQQLLFPVVSLSVAVILFEGGLTLRFSELRESGVAVFRLCSIGALISWVGAACAARYLVGFGWSVSALLGAILIVTGPTVVAPILRLIKPTRRVGSTIKWEGIVIDPIGAVLAVLVFQVLVAEEVGEAATGTMIGLAKTLVIGGGIGYATAKVMEVLLRRHLIPDYLHSALMLAAVAITFAVSNLLQHESGLLTVTVFGIVLANQKNVSVKHVLEFKENLRVLLISVLFIVLSGRVSPEDFSNIGPQGLAFLAALIFVVRPASVMLSTIGSKLEFKERIFLSFLAPRGIVAAAVASVFALELTHASEEGALPPAIAEQAAQLVPLTFAVIVGTVAFYGLLAAPLAKWLGISQGSPQGVIFAGADPWVRPIATALQEEGYAVLLIDTNPKNISEARMAGLPTCLANILSDYVAEELDLAGIGRLIAVTANDEVNSLATMEFSHIFGRAEVYQLAGAATTQAAEQKPRGGVSHHLRGRRAFTGTPTHAEMRQRFFADAVVKVTEFTEQFTYESFCCLYGENAIPLFVIQPDGKLLVCNEDTKEGFPIGQKLVALVNEPDEGEAST